jgi:hypothetical protein
MFFQPYVFASACARFLAAKIDWEVMYLCNARPDSSVAWMRYSDAFNWGMDLLVNHKSVTSSIGADLLRLIAAAAVVTEFSVRMHNRRTAFHATIDKFRPTQYTKEMAF